MTDFAWKVLAAMALMLAPAALVAMVDGMILR